MLNIVVMVKGSGYRPVKIEPRMLADMAGEISRYGSTMIYLKSGPLEVAGFYMAGKKAGDRVIILGGEDKRA
ncbi:hypothetical protein ACHHV8_25560 [Paenibacillus sp. TAB 01]|uniref:hypothetical protein n=1 Tax=Paenibacillus sp. TAB 01 TaxID=3368988 RepID=UPI003753AE91